MGGRRRTVGASLLPWTLTPVARAMDSSAAPDGAAARIDGPESGGFSSEGLMALNDGLQQQVDNQKVAGMLTMVARHGEIVHFTKYGYKDLEQRIPMEGDTIFRIYSMTKPIIGAAMMILQERGLWDLEDPVATHVPEFEGLDVAEEGDGGKIRRVSQDHPMTMRELMTHTGGLTYGLYSQSAVDTMYQRANVLDLNSSLQIMIDKLARIPLRQQPGSLWHYSVSADVQGYIIERLSGQTLPEFLEEHIFRPLAMVDTGFYVPPEKMDRFAGIVYASGPEGELVRGNAVCTTLEGDYSRLPGRPSGGGGLVSTISDYMRFAQMLLGEGEFDGIRIMLAKTVALMRADHAPTTNADGEVQLDPGVGFGMDVAVMVDPAGSESPLAKGSYWWAGAAGTWFWIDPENDLVFIGMAQHNYFDMADCVSLSRELTYRALVDRDA